MTGSPAGTLFKIGSKFLATSACSIFNAQEGYVRVGKDPPGHKHPVCDSLFLMHVERAHLKGKVTTAIENEGAGKEAITFGHLRTTSA